MAEVESAVAPLVDAAPRREARGPYALCVKPEERRAPTAAPGDVRNVRGRNAPGDAALRWRRWRAPVAAMAVVLTPAGTRGRHVLS